MNRCRACLSIDYDMYPIDEGICENFNLLTSLTILLNDGLPQSFCNFCWKTVASFIAFRDKCIASDLSLRDTKIKDEAKVELDNITIEIKEEQEDVLMNDTIDDYLKDSYFECDQDFEEIIKSEDEDKDLSLHIMKKKSKNKILSSDTKVIKSKRKYKSKNKLAVETVTEELACGLCMKSFLDKHSLSEHLEEHRNGTTCMICQAYFRDWTELLAHRFNHIDASQRWCHLCWKRFKVDISGEYHYMMKHSGKKFEGILCKFCDKRFENAHKLRKHSRIHNLTYRFICDTCSKEYNAKNKLAAHIMYHHSSVKKHVCQECGISYKTVSLLKSHRLHIHAVERFKCGACRRMFLTRAEQVKHYCPPAVICQICGKLIDKKSFNKHQMTHSQERPYKCPECPVSYKSACSLRAHRDRHAGVKRHKCPYCAREFLFPSALIKHKRVHTGEKPYVCKVCSKAFTGSHNLKVHMRVHGEYNLIVKKTAPTNADPKLDVKKDFYS